HIEKHGNHHQQVHETVFFDAPNILYLYSSSHNQGDQHKGAVQGKKNPSGCQKFISNQFSQHLNTSRNRPSTDWSRCSRISSTDEVSTICPCEIKITSSSTDSTSLIKCVE